jgi:hypothetical protein
MKQGIEMMVTQKMISMQLTMAQKMMSMLWTAQTVARKMMILSTAWIVVRKMLEWTQEKVLWWVHTAHIHL